MACRGVLFAIDDETVKRLVAAVGDDDAVIQVAGEIEDRWEAGYVAETDKSWDAMHRALSDGSLDYDAGEYPLNRCILGGQQLHSGEEWIVALVTRAEVPEVAAALDLIDEPAFRARYFGFVPKDYAPEYGEQDFEYTWDNFEDVAELYANAAAAGRAVLFTVSQ